MNRSSIIALVIGAMLLGCGAGMVASQVWETEAHAYEGQAWEYHVEFFITGPATKKFMEGQGLYLLGSRGWELMDFEQVSSGYLVVFKRLHTGSLEHSDIEFEDDDEDE